MKTHYHKNFYNLEIPYKDGMLLYNIINKNFVFLNKEYSDFYNDKQKWEMEQYSNMLKEFEDAGFILKDSIDEKGLYLKNFYLSRWYSKKLLFTIVPTTSCNFRCPYCFEQGIKFKTMQDDVKEKAKSLIEERIKTFKPESVGVSFYGGEPLLEKDKIIDFGRFFKRLSMLHGFSYNADIVTNGYLLTDKVALSLYNDAGIKSAQITVDGPESIHDARRFLAGGGKTFKRIITNIRDILTLSIDFVIRVRVNVDKTNINYMDELLKALSTLPQRDKKLEVYFSPVTGEADKTNAFMSDILFSQEEFGRVYVHKILPLLKKYGFDFERYPEIAYVFCGGITPYHILIDSDGTIKKCYDLVGRENESVGDVENYREDDKRVLLWELFDPLSEECKNCKYLPVCGGGCPYKKMKEGKNVCEMWRYVLKDLLVKIYELKEEDNEKG